MDRTVNCRRCGLAYTLGASTPVLAGCPSCGTSPRPMLRRSNAVASLLALAALGVLIVAFIKPFMTMTALGDERTVSLLEGIAELYHTGHTLIAAVVFAFSVIFPVMKLGMILAATSRIVPASAALRHRLHQVAAFTGKYSLLDVLVLAILIVLVKFEGIASVEVRIGTILFCIAVLLSLAAGLFVKLEPLATTKQAMPPRPVC